MTAEELIRKAAACRKCGEEHEYRWIGPDRASWASPRDGHDYQPVLGDSVIAQLRYLMTGIYEDPWANPRGRKPAA